MQATFGSKNNTNKDKGAVSKPSQDHIIQRQYFKTISKHEVFVNATIATVGLRFNKNKAAQPALGINYFVLGVNKEV